MNAFSRTDGVLGVDGVSLERIAAEFGTPCYVYSRASIESAFRDFDEGLAGIESIRDLLDEVEKRLS